MPAKRIPIQVELTEEEAWELSQFLKRTRLDVYRSLSMTDSEAWLMMDAGNKIQKALEYAGYSPR